MEQSEVEVKRSLTKQMLADVLSKPLQGQRHETMRAIPTSWSVDYDEKSGQN